jgi:thiamine-monophosphate kinase
MKNMASLGEFGWLKKLLPKLYWPSSLHSQLGIGPGDDAGVMRITPGKVLVATTDAMVEGLHFEPKWFSWEDLGYKVLAVNLSDLAAMGDVKPLAVLVTAAIPGDSPVDYVDKFYKGLKSCAQRWKTGLLGGDTVGSKKGWFISVTAFGETRSQDLVKRSGARPGDYIATTGPLGLAGAGLEVLQTKKLSLAWTKPLVKAFSQPEPRFHAGALLGRNRWATSLMDCSDGLEASVRLLAEASGVGVELDLVSLTIPKELSRWARLQNRHPWDYALKGGEDYELVFTVRPEHWGRVRRALPQAACIGRVVSKAKGCNAILPDRRLPLKGYGFSHFDV